MPNRGAATKHLRLKSVQVGAREQWRLRIWVFSVFSVLNPLEAVQLTTPLRESAYMDSKRDDDDDDANGDGVM